MLSWRTYIGPVAKLDKRVDMREREWEVEGGDIGSEVGVVGQERKESP